MADNHFDKTVDSLFHGMNNFMATKTVVGEAIHVGDTTILPLVDISFGMMAGATGEEKKQRGNGGMGGKMSPCALLIIKDGSTRLVSVKDQDMMTRVLDLIPGIIARFRNRNEEKQDDGVDKAVDEAIREAGSSFTGDDAAGETSGGVSGEASEKTAE